MSNQMGLWNDDEPRSKKTPEQMRDEALEWLKRYRSSLVAQATLVAMRIARERGTVTSTEVLHDMRASDEWRARVDAADRRFMGPVFRRKVWRRVGWDTSGSHCRPVAVWSLETDAE